MSTLKRFGRLRRSRTRIESPARSSDIKERRKRDKLKRLTDEGGHATMWYGWRKFDGNTIVAYINLRR